MFTLLLVILLSSSACAHDLPAGAIDLTDYGPLPVIEVPVSVSHTDTILLENQWRFACGEDSEILVGRVHNVAAGADGRVLLLDRQLDQVFVLDRHGRYLRTCGRSGEGPGETNASQDVAELPDGRILIIEGTDPGSYNFGGRGRILVWNASSDPVATWYPANQKETGEFPTARGLCVAGDRIMVGYQMMRVAPPEYTTISRLIQLDDTGRISALLGDHTVVGSFEDTAHHELDNYEPYATPRFDMGADGTMVYLPERDRYLVVVRRADGSGLRLENDIDGPRRTDAEKQDLITEHSVAPFTFEPCETKPVLVGVHCRPDGCLWVERTPMAPEAPGVFGRYDEFSPRGELLREIVLIAPGDPAVDKLCFLADGRFILIRNHHLYGEGEEDEEERDEDLESAVFLLTEA